MMKRIIYYFSAIIALSCFSCETNTPEEDVQKPDPKPDTPLFVEIRGEAAIPPYADGIMTYASVDGNEVVLGNNDSFRLYDEVGSGDNKEVSSWQMYLSSKAEGATTTPFTGELANIEGSRKFYAVYPYTSGTANAELNGYPVSMDRDQQYADAAKGKYLRSIATPVAFTGTPGEGNPLSIQFRHVTARWNIVMANSEGLAVKSVKVMTDPDGANSSDQPFLAAGTVDLTQEYQDGNISVTPGESYFAYVSSAFAEAQTGSTVSIDLYLLPVYVTGDLRLSVLLEDNTALNFPLGDFSQQFVSGMIYTMEIDLDDSEVPIIEDPDFVIENGVVTEYKGLGGEITIPDHATSIAAGAFQSNTTITEVNLNNVTEIGTNAFSSCPGLTSVNGPNVETLGQAVFNGCTALTTVNLPAVTSITGIAAFQGCTSLEEIDLSSVIETGGNLFRNCTNLRTVNLSSLKEIGAEMFQSCTNLEEVNLSSVTKIDCGNLFNGRANLRTVVLSNLKEITGIRNFYGCAALESISLPLLEGNVPFQTFMHCTTLTTVTIPKVTSVGGTDNATSNRGQVFANCDALTTLDLPEVTILSWRAINANITSLNVPKVEILQPQALFFLAKLTYIALPSLKTMVGEAIHDPRVLAPAAGVPLYDVVMDLSQATELTEIQPNSIPDTPHITVHVATQAIKDLFPAYNDTQVIVGAP